jgi:hypothetical protein
MAGRINAVTLASGHARSQNKAFDNMPMTLRNCYEVDKILDEVRVFRWACQSQFMEDVDGIVELDNSKTDIRLPVSSTCDRRVHWR